MKTISLSAKEVDRFTTLQRVIDKRLSQREAARVLGIGERQVRRLVRGLRTNGAGTLTSRKRGKRSNRALDDSLRDEALAIIRKRYHDFGPTFAHEKLVEVHDMPVSISTVRNWMIDDGIWKSRRDRVGRAHQPRNRRACLGELVQIDGSDHQWFEDRAPRCTLLVYVDDATSRLMELHFCPSEATFDYFTATRGYLERHGRPVAFYSDRHSIFRVATKDRAAGGDRETQFGRALRELNIDIICANSSQAKGRVERANGVLQDRLVKEMRLRGISTMDEGNAYALEFMEDYNRRFGKAPQSEHDAHRLLRDDDCLDDIFTWQEERTLTKNLVLHYKRIMFLVEQTAETLALRKHRCRVYEREDGSIFWRCGALPLRFRVHEKVAHVDQGEVVPNKLLGHALVQIQEQQQARDAELLASKKLTNRDKRRLKKASALPAKSPPKPTLESITSKALAAGPKREFKRASALPTLAEIEAIQKLVIPD